MDGPTLQAVAVLAALLFAVLALVSGMIFWIEWRLCDRMDRDGLAQVNQIRVGF